MAVDSEVKSYVNDEIGCAVWFVFIGLLGFILYLAYLTDHRLDYLEALHTDIEASP